MLVLWTAASVSWSLAPDRSWISFNRGLVYLAFAVLGVFAGTIVSRRHAAGALALIVATALVIALAGKVIPGLYADGARMARLRAPVGFWNALALLLAMGVPLALWLAGEARRRWPRALAAVFLFGLVVGILLTYSRSGILAAVVAGALWLGLAPGRLESAAILLAGVPVGGAVALWAFTQPGIADDGASHSARVADGWQLGVALVLGAAAAWGAAYGLLGVVPHAEQRLPSLTRRHAIAAGAALAVLLGVAGALSADEFANPSDDLLTQDPSRLTSVSSNNRWDWWQEAWTGFREAPVRGTGAGSFETTHRLLRDDPLTVTTPHSLPLQFLSETGIVGGLLAGGAAIAGLLAVAAAVRRLTGPERAAGLALAIAVTVFVVHSFVDWDWEFLALGAPVFAAFGILIGERAKLGPRRLLPAVAALAALATALVSLTLPWLAERKVDSAYASIDAGSPADGVRAAEDAAGLNPLSVEPLFAESLARSALGDLDGARESLREAVEGPARGRRDVVRARPLRARTSPATRKARVAPLEQALRARPYGPAAVLLARLGRRRSERPARGLRRRHARPPADRRRELRREPAARAREAIPAGCEIAAVTRHPDARAARGSKRWRCPPAARSRAWPLALPRLLRRVRPALGHFLYVDPATLARTGGRHHPRHLVRASVGADDDHATGSCSTYFVPRSARRAERIFTGSE